MRGSAELGQSSGNSRGALGALQGRYSDKSVQIEMGGENGISVKTGKWCNGMSPGSENFVR